MDTLTGVVLAISVCLAGWARPAAGVTPTPDRTDTCEDRLLTELSPIREPEA
jgi:hypothetical protein